MTGIQIYKMSKGSSVNECLVTGWVTGIQIYEMSKGSSVNECLATGWVTGVWLQEVSHGNWTSTETMDWRNGAQWQEMNQGSSATVVTGYRPRKCSVSTKGWASVITKLLYLILGGWLGFDFWQRQRFCPSLCPCQLWSLPFCDRKVAEAWNWPLSSNHCQP